MKRLESFGWFCALVWFVLTPWWANNPSLRIWTVYAILVVLFVSAVGAASERRVK